MFEAIMLLCFGASWPVSIYKTISVKKVTGKSVIFLWLILAGYAAGIIHKVLNNFDAVTAFYALNGVMVFCDIVLYYRYRER